MALLRQLGRMRLSIRFTVVSVFVLVTVLTATLAVGLQYYFGRQMATERALEQFHQLVDQASDHLADIDQRASQTVSMLAFFPDLATSSRDQRAALSLFAEIMRDNPLFYAIYLGFPNGDFFELINLDSSPTIRPQLRASLQDRWVAITISGEGEQRTRQFDYYNEQFVLRTSLAEGSDYDAARRPWYLQAKGDRVSKSAPYLFHNLQAPGQTYSRLLASGDAVIAVDIALSSLSNFLSEQAVTTEGQTFLFQPSGTLIASNQHLANYVSLPPSKPLVLSEEERAFINQNHDWVVSNELDWAPIDFAIAGEPVGYSIDFLALIEAMTGLRFRYENGYDWSTLKTRFAAGQIDILQPVLSSSYNQGLGQFTQPFVVLPYALVTRMGETPRRHITELEGLRLAIPVGWSIIEVIKANYPAIELVEVATPLEALQSVQQDRADAALDVSAILHYVARQYYLTGLQFHEPIDFSPLRFPNSLHFVVPESQRELLGILNKAISNVTSAQYEALAARWFSPRSVMPKDTGTVPHPELIELAQQPIRWRQLHRLDFNGEPYFVYVAPVHQGDSPADYFASMVPVRVVMGPALAQVSFSIVLSVGFLLLLTPLPWLFASPIVNPIRHLADISRAIQRRDYGAVSVPESHIKELDELGQSMLSMSTSIQNYERGQRELMDSFIQLIATAIDEKSPYTAGHCERVPQLAILLAEQAERSSAPAFSRFQFANDEERREFRIGAWLHDCGKITTPEYIVDKGSKLETLYNRIHEIRTRFEVLLRDAEIDYWRGQVEGGASEAELRERWQARQQQIHDDFAFVARMNQGAEFMHAEDRQRLLAIAQLTWTRHLSNRLGLSPLEQMRLKDEEAPLPVCEPLLINRPEHRVERPQGREPETRFGIQMAIPELLYNLGELDNLLVERGTLTTEDRFKINEHIISTIRMLDTLPFPDELARVPRYASTHHETLDGRGYPRRLRGEQLSIPERIMILADIFEALTASDRPYKHAKTISESIEILHQMVQSQHVDVEVFELFLTSGVYLEYARRYLTPEQIDTVNIDAYLRQSNGWPTDD